MTQAARIDSGLLDPSPKNASLMIKDSEDLPKLVKEGGEKEKKEKKKKKDKKRKKEKKNKKEKK